MQLNKMEWHYNMLMNKQMKYAQKQLKKMDVHYNMLLNKQNKYV